MADVLAFGEHSGGEVASITADLIAAGRGLGGEVAVALLGEDLSGLAAQAAELGADRVYTAEHPLLAGESADMIVSALEQVCLRVRPRVLLVGKTAIGRDVGPRVAFRLEVGAAQDSVARGGRAVRAGSGDEASVRRERHGARHLRRGRPAGGHDAAGVRRAPGQRIRACGGRGYRGRAGRVATQGQARRNGAPGEWPDATRQRLGGGLGRPRPWGPRAVRDGRGARGAAGWSGGRFPRGLRRWLGRPQLPGRADRRHHQAPTST